MSEALIELSNALAAATARAAAHIVAVHSGPRGSSSGVIWRAGLIVTADHALPSDEEIRVTLPGQEPDQPPDQRVVTAALVGRDATTDLAVLKCAEAVSSVPTFADPATVAAGHLTLVVGRTRASGPVVALGAVSLTVAERKHWGGTTLSPYIRLDVALQPTAVGGAVVDARGSVIGIATPKFARFGAIAIPTASVNRVADVLLSKGHVPRGYLGVGLQPVRLPSELSVAAERKGKTANIVLDVAPESPAHKAGMLIGDLLLSLDGHEVHHPGDVHSILGPDSIGKTFVAHLLRGGELRDVRINVAERPNGAE
jgi:S1-C subfamily serine protease